MAYEFYLGIDGHNPGGGRLEFATSLIEKRGNKEEASYSVRSLRRHSEESIEGALESIIDELRNDPYVGRTVCVVNATEKPGQRLHKELTRRGLSPLRVTLTGGDTSADQGRALTFTGEGAYVSEHEIVSLLEEIYRSGRLETTPADSDEISGLTQGLEDYHVKSTPKGEALDEPDFAPSRAGKNADLVLAAGVACWLGEQHSFDPTEHLAEEPPPVFEAKREMRPDTT